jgi:hypothetical protein
MRLPAEAGGSIHNVSGGRPRRLPLQLFELGWPLVRVPDIYTQPGNVVIDHSWNYTYL